MSDPRRRLESILSVRLAPDEAALIRGAAEKQGLSVSAFLRTAAANQAQGDSMTITVNGTCQRGHHDQCDGVIRTGTGWNWWCTCHCHPEPTLADAAPDSGAEQAIEFWRAHRSPE